MKNVSQPVRVTGILLLIVAMLVLANVQMGRAQEGDATAEPLPVVTVEPVPVPDETVITEREPIFTIPVWVIVGAVSAIVSGLIVAGAKENSFKRRIESIDKRTKDQAEMLYEGLSPRWQQTIDRVLDFASARVDDAAALVKLLKEMSDRQPNTEPSPTEPPAEG